MDLVRRAVIKHSEAIIIFSRGILGDLINAPDKIIQPVVRNNSKPYSQVIHETNHRLGSNCRPILLALG